MKKILSYFLFFLFGALLLTSCKSKPVPAETKETIIQKIETVKDTVLVVEKDSSYYSAYIDCVNGKPVLVQSQQQIDDYNSKNPGQSAKEPKSTAGRSVKPPAVNLENGKLSVNCEKEAEKLFFKWKETYMKEWQISNTPIYRDKPLTTFQEVKLAIGNLIIWLLGLAVLVFGIRFLISKKLF
ncbi:hypothetical protein [Epilithonimonas hispanica]|uniref:Lipoprotein n=1 Tax=Epilithonimonas hispanica TaxID=358687 RepID=A0A3D9D0C8_9FLAO|nr:hypothetical protein [Epilithonimonas hispanica]REC71371.1 hypothetical protein DRF58_06025 [Epilithonimonas hispanica]